jgi:hypothetical protein
MRSSCQRGAQQLQVHPEASAAVALATIAACLESFWWTEGTSCQWADNAATRQAWCRALPSCSLHGDQFHQLR